MESVRLNDVVFSMKLDLKISLKLICSFTFVYLIFLILFLVYPNILLS